MTSPVALISGAGSGIGGATALALAHEGFTIGAIVPLLKGASEDAGSFHSEGNVTAVEWRLSDSKCLELIANLSEQLAQFISPSYDEELFTGVGQARIGLRPGQ